MTRASVRFLMPEDIAVLREARLEALRNHPTAFSADLDVWTAMTDAQWRARVTASTWFGAFVDEGLAGICALSPGYSAKTAHIGEFGAMFVRPAYRGRHVGDSLVEAMLNFAQTRYAIVVLTVVAANKTAVDLYGRHGFRIVGTLPRALRVGGHDYDEHHMVRDLMGTP